MLGALSRESCGSLMIHECILGLALHRWHSLNQAVVANREKRLDQPAAASEAIPAPDQISSGLGQ